MTDRPCPYRWPLHIEHGNSSTVISCDCHGFSSKPPSLVETLEAEAKHGFVMPSSVAETHVASYSNLKDESGFGGHPFSTITSKLDTISVSSVVSSSHWALEGIGILSARMWLLRRPR